MLFGHPAHELGDWELIAETARLWSDGFIPDRTSRIVKFFRADATGDEFRASEWHLDDPRYVFQFGEALGDVVAQHYLANPAITQYFYMAVSSVLDRFYARIFKQLPRNGVLSAFQAIAFPLGEFHGFQRR
jgi:hypothetical protein